jgi:hypothetical protein
MEAVDQVARMKAKIEDMEAMRRSQQRFRAEWRWKTGIPLETTVYIVDVEPVGG